MISAVNPKKKSNRNGSLKVKELRRSVIRYFKEMQNTDEKPQLDPRKQSDAVPSYIPVAPAKVLIEKFDCSSLELDCSSLADSFSHFPSWCL